MPAAPRVVLDSFSLLAYFRDEAGAAEVEDLLAQAEASNQPVLMTELNYAEVNYMMLRKAGPKTWAACKQALLGLPIKFVPIDRALADGAAVFKAHFKLSLADACAAALAKSTDALLVTGDPGFKPLETVIQIHWLN